MKGTFSGFSQTDHRINTQGEAFLFTRKAVFKPPVFGACRRYFQVKALAVCIFTGFGFGNNGFADAVGQLHVGAYTLWQIKCAPNYAPKIDGISETLSDG